MKKRITALIISLTLIVTGALTYTSVFANSVQWRYDDGTQTLYISGQGDMDDYEQAFDSPWSEVTLHIKRLVVEDGVTSVGANAFAGAVELEEVSLSDSVTKIGGNAFAQTPKLLSLALGSNITAISDLSFAKSGTDDKDGFILSVQAGSYALFYAVNNTIPFNCESVKCGEQAVNIVKSTAMRAYFPYTARVSGTFNFYSISRHDPIGYVYDEEFNLLAKNDDHGNVSYQGMDSCDFGLSIQLEKGRTYYFATNIYSPVSAAKFSVFIIPVSYTVSGSIRALASADGTASQELLTGATLNGEATDGTYSVNVGEEGFTGVFTCDAVSRTHTFSADDGDSIDIVLPVCDKNADRYINAKDFAIMKQEASPYIVYYENLINYHY